MEYQPKNKIFYGSNTSLYQTLNAQATEDLEETIYLRLLGYHKTALSIFETRLTKFLHIPIVVIERAELYLRRYQLGASRRVLEEGLRFAEAGADTDLSNSEYRLMRLHLAVVKFYSQGDLTLVVREIDRTREWLANVPVGQYTDIQVNCIRLYCLADHLVSQCSNKGKPDNSTIPRTEKSQRTWQGLTDLRVSLLEQGRFNEALLVHRAERMRLPPEQRVSAVRSFLQACSTLALEDHTHTLRLEAEVRILLAQSFADCSESQEAERELIRAERVVDLYTDKLPAEDKQILAPYLLIRWTRLNLTPDDDENLRTRHLASLELLKDMKMAYDLRTDSCYNQAIDTAYRLSRQPNGENYRAVFFRLHRELQDYQEKVTENVTGLLVNFNDITHDALSRGAADARMVLEWFDGFQEKYVHFALPSYAFSMHTSRIWAFESIGEFQNARIAQAERDKWRPSLPNSIGPNIGLSRPIGGPETTNHEFSEVGLVAEVEDSFYMEWNQFSGKLEGPRQTAGRLLLKWMKEDFLSGRLKKDELTAILQANLPETAATPENLVKVELWEELDEMTEKELNNRLYWTDSDKLVSYSIWSSRFAALDTWLRRLSLKSPQNGRHYLLWTLQNHRALDMYSSKEYFHISKAEARKCITMLPTLTKLVQQYLKTTVADWTSKLAFLNLHECLESSEAFRSDRTLLLLDEAHELTFQAIKEWSKFGVLNINMASEQLKYATICDLKILHGSTFLEHERRLRDLGLEALKNMEDWVSFSRSGISWSNDLRALRLSEWFSRRWNTWTPCQLALSLQLSVEDEDGSAQQDMWKWVQRSKARSLARAMGLGAVDPHSLLQYLPTSNTDSIVALLQEEQGLLEAIEKAPLHKRYNLRVEYRDLQIRMAKQPELKRILDLREGAPLELQELEEIQNSVGVPVIFVDWVYVPTHIPGQQWRLLLVVAKAGEVPKKYDLDIQPSDIIDWITTQLTSGPEDNDGDPRIQRTMKDKRCRQHRLPMIEPLVEPLAEISRPGDILVFCPTSELHLIPLHALEIPNDPKDASKGKEVLIRRNPIVYCHSLSVLRSCFLASKAAASSNKCHQSAIFHQAPGEGYERGRESVCELAKQLGTTAVMDEAATKQAFIDVCANSGLIHVHSHVSGKDPDPLKHHILLSRDTEKPVIDSCLTTGDIFSLSLPRGSHITLIACSGGRFRVGAGNEVLGLVPAFLYSGASSTISTLWDIPDTLGARFTKLFYGFLFDETGTRGVGGFDVAKAFQKTIIALDEDGKKPPYYWAGFVLHGYWVLQTLNGEAKN